MTGITTDEETCEGCGDELAFYQFVMNDDDVVFTLVVNDKMPPN